MSGENNVSMSWFEQFKLLQDWLPLVGYAQRLVAEPDQYKKSLIVTEALEWVTEKTANKMDDQLATLVGNIAKTQQGEALIRFVVAAVEGEK